MLAGYVRDCRDVRRPEDVRSDLRARSRRPPANALSSSFVISARALLRNCNACRIRPRLSGCASTGGRALRSEGAIPEAARERVVFLVRDIGACLIEKLQCLPDTSAIVGMCVDRRTCAPI